MSVYITDYIQNPNLESRVLNDRITKNKKDAEVLLVWHQIINNQFLNNFPNLKGVVRYGVGYDMIDLEAINDRNLYFCNTPDYGTDEVSDTVIGMLMNISRGISQYNYACKRYKDNTWQENTLPNIKRTSDINFGVIGAGRIGGSILRKAKAIGFNCLFYDPYKEAGYEKMLGVRRVDSQAELLDISDIISINTPLTNETRGMVNQDFILSMKQESSIINAARGEIVSDLDIFIEPLKNNKLSSIALDVLPQEPPKGSRLIDAWRSNEEWIAGRVVINPHTSYFSDMAYIEMRTNAAKNAKRILDGETPINIIVNKD